MSAGVCVCERERERERERLSRRNDLSCLKETLILVIGKKRLDFST